MATREWTYAVTFRAEVDEDGLDWGDSTEEAHARTSEALSEAAGEFEQTLSELGPALAGGEAVLGLPDLSLLVNVRVGWALEKAEGFGA